MQNLRSQLFIIACTLIMSMQTILGVANASDHYTFHTRQFLTNLGVRNSSAVPVRKISPTDRHYNDAAGYANGTEIYLNEDLFEDDNNTEGVHLFTCAHEAAHHALRHPYQVGRNELTIEQEADVTAARMLCAHGYRWVVEEEVDLLRRCVHGGQGAWTDGRHPTTQQRYTYLSNVLNNHDRNPNQVPAHNQNNGGRNNAANEQNRRNQNNAGNRANAGRGQNPNRPGAKNNTGKAANKAGNNVDRGARAADQAGGGAHPNPERNANDAGRNNNPYRPAKSDKLGLSALRELMYQFSDLTRAQKLIIAGLLVVGYMRR